MPVPAGHTPTARTLLRDNVYTAIRDAIVRGQLLPGERLRDGELGEWLGVSRTPVREALLRLAEAGLVQAQPGKVTLVAPEDPVALAHARTIAAELHALAARLAAQELGSEAASLMRLRTANGDLRAAAQGAAQTGRGGAEPDRRLGTTDAEAAIRADAEFHDAVVELSGNPLIGTQLELLVPMLMRAEYLHFDAATVEASAAQHEAIIEALAAGDADRAAELTRRNWLSLG